MAAEASVALELGFGEKLINRRFVREGVVRFPVVAHVGGTVVIDRRLDVEQTADGVSAVDILVIDVARRAITTGTRVALRADGPGHQILDGDAQVTADLAE